MRKSFELKKAPYPGLLLVAIFCLFNSIVLAQQFPYKFHYLTVDEGLSHTDANDISQDKQGYIWVATLFGINRYDGYSLKKYYNSNSPLKNAFKNRIRCVCPDESGTVWLGTENGLQCFNSRTEKYIDFDDLQKINITFDKLVKSTGEELYGVAGGHLKLFLIKGNKVEEQRLSPPADVNFSDLALAKNGLLYLSSNKGFWILDSNRKFKHIILKGVTDPSLYVVYIDSRQNLLTASCNKVFFINKGLGAPSLTNTDTLEVEKQFASSSNNCIKGIVAGNHSDYWINAGTDLLRLDIQSNLIEALDNKRSLRNLNSFSIAKIFVDRTECLWVGTFGGGVNYCDLNEKLFYTLQHDPEISNTLSGNHIRSVLEDGENLWLGTTANGLNRYNLKTQKFQYYNTYNSAVRLKSDKITALTFDNDQNLWIGGLSGIEILKRDGSELWKPAGYDKFPTYPIGTIVKDCYGNIWFGNLRKNFGVIWKDKLNAYHVKYYGEGHFIYANKKNHYYLLPAQMA